MFAVLTLESTPDHLRGYVSRFLQQTGTNIYVGVVTPKVLDNLWEAVTESVGQGEACLISSTNHHELGFDVRLLNAKGHEMVEFDGITLPVESA